MIRASTTSVGAPDGTPPGALAPLRVTVFRWLWIAGLVSSIGSWMQSVGAQWFLVEQSASPAVIALVSTAAAAPVLLFGIPAGVLGEFMDRRRLLIGVQAAQAAISLVLVVLTAADLMTPALLLSLTFALGAATAVQLPAYQAIVPEIVPTPLIANAASLSSIGVNVARAIGPAVAGVLIAQLGIPFVFAINVASFLFFLLVLVLWRGYTAPPTSREPFIAASRAGLRYVGHSAIVRRMYVQLLLFMIPANALWALLPVLANGQLGLAASGYGLLLAAVGLGSVCGAFVLPPLRAKIGVGGLVMVSSAVYGVGIAVIAFSTTLAVTLPILVVIGTAWIGVIASLNGTVQSFLPVWVRTRGLSVYQLVFYGGTALGAAVSGVLGGILGVAETMIGAGVVVVVVAALQLVWPFGSTVDKKRDVVPLPLTDVPPVALVLPGDGASARATASDRESDGATLVIVRYAVASVDRARFVDAMQYVEHSRRRTGARAWHLYDSREQPGTMVEAFTVGSWSEHLRQHESRTTGYDAEVLEAVRALTSADPVIEHLVAVDRD